MMFQCSLWVSYGVVTPHRTCVIATNAFGVAMELTWCCIYLAFCKSRLSQIGRMLGVAGLWLALTTVDVRVISNFDFQPLKAGE